jgi:quinol-cytochrome oxidoreductase complex cytochrome b subunit
LTAESEKVSFHPNWLRVMYVVNIFVTGGIAVLLLVAPDTAASLFSSPAQEPLFSGYASSYMLAIAIVSILGFRSPLKFSPVLFLQAIGKIIWLLAILLPAMIAGPLSTFAIYLVATFLPILIGDLIVTPYKYIFKK